MLFRVGGNKHNKCAFRQKRYEKFEKGNAEEYLLIKSKIRYTHGWDKINW